MYKSFYLTLLFCASAGFASSQAPISNNIFPQAGQVLDVSTSFNVENTTIDPPSGFPYAWDFTYLYSDDFRQDTIMDAASGSNFADFPNTEIIQDLLPGLGGTAYVDVSATEVQVIGGGLDLGIIAFVEPLLDPRTLQIAPVTYGGSYNDNSQFAFAEHIDSVPFLSGIIDSFAGQLPFGAEPDSIRLSVETERQAEVDAFGTVTTHDSTYAVLREKVVDYTFVKIEMYLSVPILGGLWYDVTSLIGGVLPLPIPTEDTLISYNFLCEDYQQPVVRLNVASDDATVESIDFMGYREPVAISQLQTALSNFNVYPNPAQQSMRIDLGESPKNSYELELIDISGRVWLQQSNLMEQTTELNVSMLPRGYYVTIIRDEKGQLLGSQKVILVD